MPRYFEDYVEATKRKFQTTVSTLTINTETFKIGASQFKSFSTEFHYFIIIAFVAAIMLMLVVTFCFMYCLIKMNRNVKNVKNEIELKEINKDFSEIHFEHENKIWNKKLLKEVDKYYAGGTSNNLGRSKSEISHVMEDDSLI